MSWKYLPRVIEVAAVVETNVEPVVIALPVVEVGGLTQGERPLFVTSGGVRYHTQSDNSGLRTARSISTKTACRLCATNVHL